MNIAQNPIRRYSREAVGALLIITVALFVLGAMQAGRIQQWLNPGLTLKVIMPEEGLYGLSTGADVEILGTRAGQVSEVVIDPQLNMHALVTLRREVTPFLREDSKVLIKRRFGIAGDAYLEITRGTTKPLDAQFPVLEASADSVPTQSVEQLIAEVRDRALPILDQAEAAIGAIGQLAQVVNGAQGDVRGFLASVRGISQSIDRGDGTIGRLVNDNSAMLELEAVLSTTQQTISRLGPVLAEMQTVARNAALTSQQLGKQSAQLPKVMDSTIATLDSLRDVMKDIKKTTPQLPRLTRNIADSTQGLPQLILQSQQSLSELEALIQQLRSNWLFGGSGQQRQESKRISPLDIRP